MIFERFGNGYFVQRNLVLRFFRFRNGRCVQFLSILIMVGSFCNKHWKLTNRLEVYQTMAKFEQYVQLFRHRRHFKRNGNLSKKA